MRQWTLREGKQLLHVTQLVSDRAGLGTQACVVLEKDTAREGAIGGLSWLECQMEQMKNTGHPVRLQINNHEDERVPCNSGIGFVLVRVLPKINHHKH